MPEVTRVGQPMRGTLIKGIIKYLTLDEKMESSLTQSEKSGVRERVKRKEIVRVQTNKSGKLGVCPLEANEQMKKLHVMNVKVSS